MNRKILERGVVFVLVLGLLGACSTRSPGTYGALQSFNWNLGGLLGKAARTQTKGAIIKAREGVECPENMSVAECNRAVSDADDLRDAEEAAKQRQRHLKEAEEIKEQLE